VKLVSGGGQSCRGDQIEKRTTLEQVMTRRLQDQPVIRGSLDTALVSAHARHGPIERLSIVEYRAQGSRPLPRAAGTAVALGPPTCIMMYHQSIMRTTIDLPEHLLIEAKKLAATRRISMARLVEESVRAYLSDERRKVAASVPVHLPVLHGPQPARDIDLNDTSRLWEIE
jgi:hypothetical protein